MASPATSPWPPLVALGLATSEFGILVGSMPLVVFGLVLFGGSGAGLVHEAGYGSSPGRPMQAVGGLFAVGGCGVWLAWGSTASLQTLLAGSHLDGLTRRAVGVVLAGVVLVALGTVGYRWSVHRE